MTFEELNSLKRKVDRVIASDAGKEYGRGLYVGHNQWMTQILIDGKSKQSPYVFMNHLVAKEERAVQRKPKAKVQGPASKNKSPHCIQKRPAKKKP